MSQILDLNDESGSVFDTNKVQSSCLFNLLQSMETNLTDNIRIMDLVKISKSESGTSSISNVTTPTETTTSPTRSEYKLNQNFSSPANLLTNAGSTAAVLSVSGITATNLLITSSGTLGMAQMASYNPILAANLNTGSNQNQPPTILPNPDHPLSNLIPKQSFNINSPESNSSPNLNNVAMSPGNRSNDALARNSTPMRALDFCYLDDQSNKFNIKDSINLCVTVIAYASQAYRTNQMLSIMDILIPRYLNHMKSETNKIQSESRNIAKTSFGSPIRNLTQQDIVQHAKQELSYIQKVATSIKTLLNISDFMTRLYVGPTKTDTTSPNNQTGASAGSNLNKRALNRSPSIMQDEDSVTVK